MYILLWCTFTEYHKPWSIRFNRTVSIVWMAMWRYRLVETRLLIASLTSYTYLHGGTWSMLNYKPRYISSFHNKTCQATKHFYSTWLFFSVYVIKCNIYRAGKQAISGQHKSFITIPSDTVAYTDVLPCMHTHN